MKIVYTLDSFFPDSLGGTEHYVMWLSKYLQRSGHEISIIAATTSASREYEYEGVPVYRFLVPPKPISKELNGLIPPRGIEDFKRLLLKLQPDIVHFHSFSRAINSFHLQLAKKMGFHTVFTAHLGGLFCVKGDFLLFNKTSCNGKVNEHRCLACYLFSKSKSSDASFTIKSSRWGIPYFLPASISHLLASEVNLLLHSPFRKRLPAAWNLVHFRKQELTRLNQFADEVVAIAPWILKVYQLNKCKNVKLIRQGIPFLETNGDLFQLENHKSYLSYQQFPVKLIFVGRLHPIKGLHLLLSALKGVDREKFHLTVIGIHHEPQYREAMKAEAESLGMVDWKENLSRPNVLKELQQTGIVVLPSINEMAPLVVLEAFACGKPVIGSDYPAISNMVTHNFNGLLFENNNVQSLQHCLQRLINEPELLLRLSSKIAPPPTFTRVSNEMLNIYQCMN